MSAYTKQAAIYVADILVYSGIFMAAWNYAVIGIILFAMEVTYLQSLAVVVTIKAWKEIS